LDRAIVGGEEVSREDCAEAEATARQLGIPQQFALKLLPLIKANRAAGQAPAPVAVVPAAQARHREEKMLRGQVEQAARKYAYRAGLDPREVNLELRRAGHPPRRTATTEQLGAILDTLAAWYGGLK
jgi:hypothetical protein